MSYTVRVRGALSLISRDFVCDVCGPFDARVPKEAEGCDCPVCGQPAPRVMSAPPVHTAFVITASRGPSSKPPAGAPDFRPLAEGQTYSEWKAERRKHWREVDWKRRKEAVE